jgi:hypothetical protein
MAEKTCAHCSAPFQGLGGARYCSPGCREGARRSREKTGRLRTLRQIGEECYQGTARVAIGDSDSRRIVSDICHRRNIDLDDPVARDMLEKLEAAEVTRWQLIDDLRRSLEGRE